MKDTTNWAILKAIAEWRRDMADALVSNGLRSYISGDMRAFGYIKMEPPPGTIQTAAQQFARLYSDQLIEKGGTMVWDADLGKSVFKPWLADSAESARDDISRIIQQGIDEGRTLGVKERGIGGYPEGTVAHDLEAYFGSFKSQASTVARTETARIQNDGQLNRYSERGYSEVIVMDDEGPNSCDACAGNNGQHWTVEYAQEHGLQHPNCVIDFAPVISDFPYTPEDAAKLAAIGMKKDWRGEGCQAENR